MAKRYDMAVKTGSYKDKDGVDKGRYETVGSVHSNRDGNGHFAVLSTARLMGIVHMAAAKGEDTVMVSLFQPDSRAAPQPAPQPPTQQASPSVYNEFGDDIPF